MSDCINTVSSLMPSTSNFSGSDVERILDETVGPYFDGKVDDIEEVITAPFLTEATGEYLDLIHGRLYGLVRVDDETDDEYRNRLIFQTKDGITLSDLRELGCNLYAFVSEYDIDTKLTSRNPKLTTNKVMISCPNDTVEQLIKDNLIWEKLVVFI